MKKRRAWKPLAGSVRENAIIRELRDAIDQQDMALATLRGDLARVLQNQNASIPRVGEIQPQVQTKCCNDAEDVVLEVGLGAAAPSDACSFFSGGTAVDVDTRTRIARLRFYLQSPATAVLYRVECWKMNGLTLTERVGWGQSVSITTQATPEGHWAEIGGLRWDLEPEQRYGFIVSKVDGGYVALALSAEVVAEHVPGLGQVATGHFHTNTPIAAGLVLSDNSAYRARFTLFPEGNVPPHSHEIIDVRGLKDALGGEAHFSYQGMLALHTGAQRLYNTSGEERIIESVSLSVGTAPTGAAVIGDVNVDGVSIFTAGAEPRILDGATLGVAAPSAPSWPSGSYLTVDVDQIGSAAPGSDLTAVVMYS